MNNLDYRVPRCEYMSIYGHKLKEGLPGFEDEDMQ